MDTKYLYSVRMKGYPSRLCVCKAAVTKETAKTVYFTGDEESGYHRSAAKTASPEGGCFATAGTGFLATAFYTSPEAAIEAARGERRAKIETLQAEITVLDERERTTAK